MIIGEVIFLEKKDSIKNYFLCFILYSIIGWIYEVFLEVVIYKWGFSNRGVLFGPYCPVYGVGALIFIFTVYGLIKDKDLKKKLLMLPIIFISCMFIATVVELIASYLCEAFLGSWPWDYSGYKINFQGRIGLSPSVRFGLGGCAFLYILQPLFEKLFNKMGKARDYVFYVVLGIFVIDIICTTISHIV